MKFEPNYLYESEKKGKRLRRHSFHWKIAASDSLQFILLKLFMNGSKRCYTTDASLALGGTIFSNVNNVQSMIPEEQKITTTQ